MGGTIGLAVKFSDGTEWRNSCSTSILACGLFAVDFYIKENSEQHVRNFLNQLIENRNKDHRLQ